MEPAPFFCPLHCCAPFGVGGAALQSTLSGNLTNVSEKAAALQRTAEEIAKGGISFVMAAAMTRPFPYDVPLLQKFLSISPVFTEFLQRRKLNEKIAHPAL